VILLDPAKDMLWGRFREDLAEIADEDELDVLEGMADMIATRAREEGATRLFHGLLDTLSNYVRMEEPRTLPDPLDWSAAADRLFEERIQNPRGAAG
jgi:hypothetical protein